MGYKPLAALICLTLSTLAIARQGNARGAAQSSSELTAARELDGFIKEVMAFNITAGMAVAVVQNDRMVFAKGYGVTDVDRPRPVTADTQFYVASTTKALTALAALIEEQKGHIDLGAPISNYLPDMRLDPALDPNAITVMDCLTHSHGISGEGPVVERTAYSGSYTYRQLYELMALHPPARNGRRFEYSNVGYNIAGFVLDPRREDGWKEIVDRDVLRPLGMRDTTAYISRADKDRLAMPHGWNRIGLRRIAYAKADKTMHAAGGHISTVNDMSKLLTVEMNGGKIGGKAVFPATLIERSQTKHINQDRMFGLIKRDGWGVGWDLGLYDGERIVHRFGGFSGFQSHVSFVPDKHVAVVGFVNTAGPAALALHMVALHAYEVFLGMENLPQRRAKMLDSIRQLRTNSLANEAEQLTARTKGEDTLLPKLAGVYCNAGYGKVTVTARPGGVHIKEGLIEADAGWVDAARLRFRAELPIDDNFEFRITDGAKGAAQLIYAGATFERIGGNDSCR